MSIYLFILVSVSVCLSCKFIFFVLIRVFGRWCFFSISGFVVGNMRKDPTLLFVLLLVLLVLVSASPIKNDFSHCEKIVKNWAVASLEQEVKHDKHVLRDLLFFLHVPRTGGRTYFHCFLRKLYHNSEECPRSYDKLRFDPSKQKCRLLVTHDDYSMMSKLPKEKTSVVTILRNPVDRVFSTYEFSVEVAARFLVHPNLTSATKMAGQLRPRNGGISTLNIWPWKYLVPWMREDLFNRRDARKLRGSNHVKSKDPYNMEEMVMPLHEYISDPIAHDIIHNGATFQVAGLTNNSYFAESHEVRHCVQKFKTLGEHVLQVAKKRLDEMLYVGLTEDHRESATMFANVVGAQVISQGLSSNSSMENAADNPSEQSSSVSDSEPESEDHQNSTSDQKASEIASPENLERKKGNMTVKTLMEAYEDCISNLRKAQARRRTNSLKRIAPANFSKEDRHHVPKVVLEQIRSLNNLDLELYKYAQDIYAKQHKRTTQKLASTEGLEGLFNNSGGVLLWKPYSLVVSFILLLVILVMFVNAKRRTAKVKI
ncbi:protein-tyrosine sulfotransferase isoform X2 [Jatropha curcas]|uniref:protein-tyrosine sulfotransferase isoform X2 n=1 Tax=Jatropha curcas TaxID=180498 RepID=UPI001894F3F4|nr:protein-tyrosine sulfotransferase isoform X2 [Jatropha curcas]